MHLSSIEVFPIPISKLEDIRDSLQRIHEDPDKHKEYEVSETYESLGIALFYYGEYRDAEQALLLAQKLRKEQPSPKNSSRISFLLGVVTYRLGDSLASEAHFTQAVSLAKSIGNTEMQCAALSNLAIARYLQNRVQEGIEKSKEALDLVTKVYGLNSQQYLDHVRIYLSGILRNKDFRRFEGLLEDYPLPSKEKALLTAGSRFVQHKFDEALTILTSIQKEDANEKTISLPQDTNPTSNNDQLVVETGTTSNKSRRQDLLDGLREAQIMFNVLSLQSRVSAINFDNHLIGNPVVVIPNNPIDLREGSISSSSTAPSNSNSVKKKKKLKPKKDGDENSSKMRQTGVVGFKAIEVVRGLEAVVDLTKNLLLEYKNVRYESINNEFNRGYQNPFLFVPPDETPSLETLDETFFPLVLMTHFIVATIQALVMYYDHQPPVKLRHLQAFRLASETDVYEVKPSVSEYLKSLQSLISPQGTAEIRGGQFGKDISMQSQVGSLLDASWSRGGASSRNKSRDPKSRPATQASTGGGSIDAVARPGTSSGAGNVNATENMMLPQRNLPLIDFQVASDLFSEMKNFWDLAEETNDSMARVKMECADALKRRFGVSLNEKGGKEKPKPQSGNGTSDSGNGNSGSAPASTRGGAGKRGKDNLAEKITHLCEYNSQLGSSKSSLVASTFGEALADAGTFCRTEAQLLVTQVLALTGCPGMGPMAQGSRDFPPLASASTFVNSLRVGDEEAEKSEAKLSSEDAPMSSIDHSKYAALFTLASPFGSGVPDSVLKELRIRLLELETEMSRVFDGSESAYEPGDRELRFLVNAALLKLSIALNVKLNTVNFVNNLGTLANSMVKSYQYRDYLTLAWSKRFQLDYEEWTAIPSQSSEKRLTRLAQELLPLHKEYVTYALLSNDREIIRDSLKRLMNWYLEISNVPASPGETLPLSATLEYLEKNCSIEEINEKETIGDFDWLRQYGKARAKQIFKQYQSL